MQTREPSAIAFGTGRRTGYERNASIHEVFARQASQTPSAVAVRAGDVALTYAELERSANRLANYLRSAGVSRGDSVAIALSRSARVPIALLAVLKAGAAYVPLDPAQPAERTSFMLADTGAALTIAEQSTRAGLLASTATVIDLDLDAADIAAAPATTPEIAVSATDLAYIMYTSGSTGRPKGVACVHRGVVRLVRQTDFVSIEADEVVLQFAPLGFDAATFEIWAPLLNGAQLVVAEPGTLSLDALGQTIATTGVTTLWLTAPLFAMMVDASLPSFRNVRQLLTGGDIVSAAHAARFLESFPACRLIDGYGPTENTTFSCTYAIPSVESIERGVPIGRPIANSTAYVLDENRDPVEPGEIGELYVGGDGLAAGYVNLPELTAERFVEDRFANEPDQRLYRTGDRVRLRVDGILEFLGRADLQVKIRGYRIEIEEIEQVLRSRPDVVDAALSVVDGPDEKTLAAHVVLKAGAPADARQLRADLSSRLPQHMVPAHFIFAETLPAHPSGKLDRIALSEQTVRALQTGAGASPARTKTNESEIASAVRETWTSVLSLEREPDPDQNFFDAGGDSLRLLRLHSELQKRLQIKLDLVDFFQHTTIRTLSAFLEKGVR